MTAIDKHTLNETLTTSLRSYVEYHNWQGSQELHHLFIEAMQKREADENEILATRIDRDVVSLNSRLIVQVEEVEVLKGLVENFTSPFFLIGVDGTFTPYRWFEEVRRSLQKEHKLPSSLDRVELREALFKKTDQELLLDYISSDASGSGEAAAYAAKIMTYLSLEGVSSPLLDQSKTALKIVAVAKTLKGISSENLNPSRGPPLRRFEQLPTMMDLYVPNFNLFFDYALRLKDLFKRKGDQNTPLFLHLTYICNIAELMQIEVEVIPKDPFTPHSQEVLAERLKRFTRTLTTADQEEFYFLVDCVLYNYLKGKTHLKDPFWSAKERVEESQNEKLREKYKVPPKEREHIQKNERALLEELQPFQQEPFFLKQSDGTMTPHRWLEDLLRRAFGTSNTLTTEEIKDYRKALPMMDDYDILSRHLGASEAENSSTKGFYADGVVDHFNQMIKSTFTALGLPWDNSGEVMEDQLDNIPNEAFNLVLMLYTIHLYSLVQTIKAVNIKALFLAESHIKQLPFNFKHRSPRESSPDDLTAALHQFEARAMLNGSPPKRANSNEAKHKGHSMTESIGILLKPAEVSKSSIMSSTITRERSGSVRKNQKESAEPKAPQKTTRLLSTPEQQDLQVRIQELSDALNIQYSDPLRYPEALISLKKSLAQLYLL